VHDEARTAAETDWPQILPSTKFSSRCHGTSGHAEPRGGGGQGHGPRAGLALVGTLDR